jgi:hypothetical protein
MISSRPEVEWDETEQQWMTELARWEDELLCPLCGWPKEICQNPANENAFDAAGYRCHVTTALRRAQDAARNPGNGVVAMPHQDAVSWQATPKARTHT